MLADEFNLTWDAKFEEYWKPLLQTDGGWDEAKIKNEMHDLAFVAEQVSEVYLHITGGQLSKPMYYADGVIHAHDNEVARAVEEAVGDCKECKTLIEGKA